MSIEDEINQRRNEVAKEKARIEAEERKRLEEEHQREVLNKALYSVGMHPGQPMLQTPTGELQTVIQEVLPQLRFTEPKRVKIMPDGNYYCQRWANRREADAYSYDIIFKSTSGEFMGGDYYVSIYENGSISLGYIADSAKDRLFITESGWDWDQKQDSPYNLRKLIIEDLANPSTEKVTYYETRSYEPKPDKKGGCYIATCVYGDYNCPEVWVLRRYRDYYLKNKWYGKLFIKVYYFFGPKLVNSFGNNYLFVKTFKKYLDSKIEKLLSIGYSDSKYEDE